MRSVARDIATGLDLFRRESFLTHLLCCSEEQRFNPRLLNSSNGGGGGLPVGSAYHVVLAVKTLRAGLRPVLGESSSLRYDES